MRHIESNIQKNCVAWFRLQYPHIARLLFAVPNGGARNKIEAGIMKGEGVTAGVADILLLYPSPPFHALCIEFKSPKGRQQASQKEWQRLVEEHGYKYAICRSFDDFRETIRGYFPR